MHTWSSPFDGLQSTLICRLHVLLVSVTNSSIKQCHIICMTSYARQHISNTADYVILVAMGLNHTTISLHDMIPCMYMSQLISPLQYLPFKVFFTLSWCTNLYVSFFIATPGMYKEFQRKLCQNQWMVKATSAAECYSWLYEGGGGKINMYFAWT